MAQKCGNCNPPACHSTVKLKMIKLPETAQKFVNSIIAKPELLMLSLALNCLVFLSSVASITIFLWKSNREKISETIKTDEIDRRLDRDL